MRTLLLVWAWLAAAVVMVATLVLISITVVMHGERTTPRGSHHGLRRAIAMR